MSWFSFGSNNNAGGDSTSNPPPAPTTNLPVLTPEEIKARNEEIKAKRLRAMQQESSVGPPILVSTPSVSLPPASNTTSIEKQLPREEFEKADNKVLLKSKSEPAPVTDKKGLSVPYVSSRDHIRKEIDLFESVFLVTLKKEKSLFADSLVDGDLVYIDDFDGVQLTRDTLSEVMYSRLSMNLKISPLVYLRECYERAYMKLQYLSDNPANESLRAAAIYASELCANYTATIFMEPSIFPNTLQGKTITEHLIQLVQVAENKISNTSFFAIVVQEIEKQSQVEALFSPVFLQLFTLMSNISSFKGDYMLPLGSLLILCKNKSIGAMLINKPTFLPMAGYETSITGIMCENNHMLAPFLRLCLGPNFSRAFAEEKFANLKYLHEVEREYKSSRDAYHGYIKSLSSVFSWLLKVNPVVKERVMNFFSLVVRVNADRAKERPGLNISSEHFVMNIAFILIDIALPILDSSKKLRDKIDYSYVSKAKNIFSSSLQPITGPLEGAVTIPLATEAAFNEASFSFMTRAFFLALRAIHVGIVSIINGTCKRLNREGGYLANRGAFSLPEDNLTPAQQQLKLQAMSYRVHIAGYESFLCDKVRMGDCLTILSASARWLVIEACGFDVKAWSNVSLSNLKIVLPLTTEPSLAFKSIPQHLIEDICDVLKYVGQNAPEILENIDLEDFFVFLVVFLSSPKYIFSPHLLSKFASAIYYVFLPSEGKKKSVHAETYLIRNPIGQFCLAPALMENYGAAERLGAEEKIQQRYEISKVLRFIWEVPEHRATFKLIGTNHDVFVSFANGVMNNTNKMMVESLGNLPQIKALQLEIANTVEFERLPADEQEQKKSNLEELEKYTPHFLKLCLETLYMIQYLTSEVKDPFLSPELCQRMADSLISILDNLAGPKGMELKVNNAEKYNFKPKDLLTMTIEILLNLSDSEDFAKSICASAYYRESSLNKASGLASRGSLLLSKDRTIQFQGFVVKLIETKRREEEAEADLGEIPEEFLDPLLQTLMTDPVKLPVAKETVDRSTILQILLNGPVCPFSRAPLTAKDLVDDVELKARIDEWLRSKGRKP